MNDHPITLAVYATAAGEAAAVGTMALTVLGYMPQVAALFTVLWYIARFGAWIYRSAIARHDRRSALARQRLDDIAHLAGKTDLTG